MILMIISVHVTFLPLKRHGGLWVIMLLEKIQQLPLFQSIHIRPLTIIDVIKLEMIPAMDYRLYYDISFGP